MAGLVGFRVGIAQSLVGGMDFRGVVAARVRAVSGHRSPNEALTCRTPRHPGTPSYFPLRYSDLDSLRREAAGLGRAKSSAHRDGHKRSDA